MTNNKSQSKNAKRANRRGTDRKRKQAPNPRGKRKRGLPPAADLLLNPCTATLRPGFHSTHEGILSRFKTVANVSSGDVNGYVVWSPHYADGGPSRYGAYIYYAAASADIPLNTAGTPFGVGGATTAGQTNVGASVFVSGNTCSDFRLLSACMQLTYTGSIGACQGSVCRITNLPADTLLHGNAAGGPISVDDMFALSPRIQRLSLDTMELRHRPDTALVDAFKGSHDSVYYNAGGTATVMTNEAKRFDPTFFGFAFKNIVVGSLECAFTQNIEWRPDGSTGLVATVPRQLHDSGYYERIVKQLDEMMPDWQHAASGALKSLLYRTITNAWAPGNRLN